jgi:hypothetical protein
MPSPDLPGFFVRAILAFSATRAKPTRMDGLHASLRGDFERDLVAPASRRQFFDR